jgi:hypothetical protein
MRKLSYYRLSSMWSRRNYSFASTEEDATSAFIKKSMDDICFQAELASSTIEYAEAICQGMERLLDKGVPFSMIQRHHNLFQKLMFLGRDLMQMSSPGLDLFYLGIFIELKIDQEWKSSNFYKLVRNSLLAIKKNMTFLAAHLKNKLLYHLQLERPKLHQVYFTSSA